MSRARAGDHGFNPLLMAGMVLVGLIAFIALASHITRGFEHWTFEALRRDDAAAAQLLAVQKQQVHRWGSVLDAQHARVERAIADLERVHPDYWQYLQTLADIDRVIADAVDRMRGRV